VRDRLVCVSGAGCGDYCCQPSTGCTLLYPNDAWRGNSDGVAATIPVMGPASKTSVRLAGLHVFIADKKVRGTFL
jgi:hypothetical protein